jgi:hypothetical protein
MELSLNEYNELSDERMRQAIKVAHLEHCLAEEQKKKEELLSQLERQRELDAEREADVSRLQKEVDVLRKTCERHAFENALLRNYIILSVEKIQQLMPRLQNVDRCAFLKSFLEWTLPKEHFVEQMKLVNEVITLPDERVLPSVQIVANEGSSLNMESAQISGSLQGVEHIDQANVLAGASPEVKYERRCL